MNEAPSDVKQSQYVQYIADAERVSFRPAPTALPNSYLALLLLIEKITDYNSNANYPQEVLQPLGPSGSFVDALLQYAVQINEVLKQKIIEQDPETFQDIYVKNKGKFTLSSEALLLHGKRLMCSYLKPLEYANLPEQVKTSWNEFLDLCLKERHYLLTDQESPTTQRFCRNSEARISYLTQLIAQKKEIVKCKERSFQELKCSADKIAYELAETSAECFLTEKKIGNMLQALEGVQNYVTALSTKSLASQQATIDVGDLTEKLRYVVKQLEQQGEHFSEINSEDEEDICSSYLLFPKPQKNTVDIPEKVDDISLSKKPNLNESFQTIGGNLNETTVSIDYDAVSMLI